ncbi:unnamed protein product [Xylocopa violacea]|uniref:Uncharacterized protein n=1 Tax=Xylocopa violacea TaxID=135666 RepID=A0ABP1NGU9_XYLVO
MMNKECPSCRQITNTARSRLVKDSCGHIKCRMCLMYEEQGCKICIDEHNIQNIGNYDCLPLEKEIAKDRSISEKDNTCNDVLPLELVINKDSKFKENFEYISVDYANNQELYCESTVNKGKEKYELSTTDVKDNEISSKLYASNVESNGMPLNIHPHISNNVAVKSSSTQEASEVCDLKIKETEFSRKERLIKNRSMKCPDRSHITIIPGIPEKYKCNICTKIFQNKKGKCYHDACVTGVKPYQCPFCDRSFIKRSHFEYHERIHRGYKPFKCNLCEKSFPQQNKLNRHMYSHGSQKQFVCSKCDKRYTKRDDLKNHLGIHSGTTAYSCKICEKTFRLLTNLKRHLKTHANERPYVCDQCNKSFKDKSLLIRHKKTHGKDRPFSCAHCNRVFLSKSELRRHLTVHSDEKPFSCKYCETVFRRKDNLHRHIRHHHPESSPFNNNKVENTITEASIKLTKTKQINAKQKQKTKKAQKVTCNLLPKTPTKVSVVYISSCDQINSRLDSMGNITPVIRTTNEVSNAVSVINGPINIKKSEDKTDIRKKTFTYTEPIPLAEAVVINKRIEEKLYPQNVSNHNYFLRNCLTCTDKTYPTPISQISRANSNMKYSGRKTTQHENFLSESSSNVQTNFAISNTEQQIYNAKAITLQIKDNSNHLVDNL